MARFKSGSSVAANAGPDYQFFRALLLDPCREFTGDKPYFGSIFEQCPDLALTYGPCAHDKAGPPLYGKKKRVVACRCPGEFFH